MELEKESGGDPVPLVCLLWVAFRGPSSPSPVDLAVRPALVLVIGVA